MNKLIRILDLALAGKKLRGTSRKYYVDESKFEGVIVGVTDDGNLAYEQEGVRGWVDPVLVEEIS